MSERLDRVYELLVDEEDDRVCKAISDQACHEVPGNFFLILLTQTLTKLGDALASTKTVLPWLMSAIGAPTFLSGLLVPIRESFSMLPQIFVGPWIQRRSVRKWVFVAGCVIQGVSVAAMALAALVLGGWWGGVAILLLVWIFSLARSLCSVSSKDILGKTIPKTRRGTLTGYSASAAGVISIGLGATLYLGYRGDLTAYVGLLLIAAGCWWLAAFGFSRVAEFKSEPENDPQRENPLAGLSLLRDDKAFRRFVLVRCLLMSSGLSAPYFILLAQNRSYRDTALGLGLFIIFEGLAGLLSGAVWGRLADWSSRKVLILVAVLTTVLCSVASAVALFFTSVALWVWLLLFFVLATVHQGVRLGRKTYIVDLAEGNRRTDYVTVSNTVVGLMLIAIGVLGAGLAQFSVALVLLVFAFSAAIAAILSATMSEIQGS